MGISDARWAEAQRRAAVISPLASLESVPASAARDAGRILGLSERTIYGLLRLWQRSGGLVTSLAPEPSSGGRGKGRLTAAAEHLLTEAIRDEYLSKQKKRAEAVVRAVRDRCRAAGITPPAANTVRARVRRVRADKAARFREGSGSAAALRLTPAAGETPPAAHPMAVLQVDHTLVDLILVDETWRKPIGRPWLSVAIDTYSRCVAGLHLSYEAPSATVAGLCIAHAGQDKAVYLRGLNIKADWPCQGGPGEVFVDNGSEFHATAFERGCQQHAIALRFRPPGAPHRGGIVERLVGTTMTMVHELPGTTFSNPAQRGEYDSDATACLTLAELERWLVLAITGSYHNAVHGGLDEPPLARWKNGVAAHGAPSALSDPHAFMVDFLPVLRRRITREGIVVDHIAYFSDALRPLVAARDRLAQVLVRRDPRDLSRVWVLDPEGGGMIEVSCSRQGRPRISLHEHRFAVAYLREHDVWLFRGAGGAAARHRSRGGTADARCPQATRSNGRRGPGGAAEVHDLTTRGVGLRVLAGEGAAIDTTTANGRLEFERELIVERTKAGLAAARARGRNGGRPFKMTTAKLRLAQAAMGQPGTKVGDLCAELGVSRQTLYRHVAPKGTLWPDGLALLDRRRPPAASHTPPTV